MGNCQLIECNNGKIIANLFGQAYAGYDGKQYTSIPALRKSLESLKMIAKEKNQTVALPYKIGSCRGGADWNEVYAIIEEFFNDYSVILYKLDLG